MIRFFHLLVCALLLCSAPASAHRPARDGETVRNVVLMIGDGMGLGQVAALMIENDYRPVSFDRAQSVALCKTYSANNRVTDSAAAATAMATGQKTANSRIGVTPDGSAAGTLLELARARGLGTGMVVTSHLCDATPAAFAAHVADRHDRYRIAEMLAAHRIDVLAGGGRRYFTRRKDGRDLLREMQQAGCTCVPSPEAFYAARRTPLAGLFADKYMPAAPERDSAYLARATQHTLELLARNRRGFFAMIEGSQIDGACHDNDTGRMIAEMRDFDRAVACAFDFADRHPGTLVVVVADHETGGLTILSNKSDFTTCESGIRYHYSTRSHSGTPVVLYAYGAGAHHFKGVMENTDVFRLLSALLPDGDK